MHQSSKINDIQMKPPHGGGFNPPDPPGDPWPTRAETNEEVDRWFGQSNTQTSACIESSSLLLYLLELALM
jgi:hypothetical protein